MALIKPPRPPPPKEASGRGWGRTLSLSFVWKLQSSGVALLPCVWETRQNVTQCILCRYGFRMPDFMHFHMCEMFTAFLVLKPVSELNVHPKDSSEWPWKRPSHRFCSEGRRLEDRHLLTGVHARPFQW